MYCQWIVKDSIFFSLYVVFISSFSYSLIQLKREGELDNRTIALFLVSGVLTSLMRNNGSFSVVIGMVIIALMAFRRHGRRAIGVVAVIAASALLIPTATFALNSATQAQKGSAAEALSIPFQQTARYMRDHHDDIDKWEYDAIGSVLDVESIGNLYDPIISDPVKGTYKPYGNDKQYIKAYIAQGLKHPETYIEAFLEQTYGYFSIGCYYDQISPRLNTREQTQNLEAFLNIVQSIPLIGLFLQTGIWFWICSAIALFSLKKRSMTGLALLVPGFLLFLTCVASPVNGCMRYMLGIIASVPITWWSVIAITKIRHDSARTQPDGLNAQQ